MLVANYRQNPFARTRAIPTTDQSLTAISFQPTATKSDTKQRLIAWLIAESWQLLAPGRRELAKRKIVHVCAVGIR
jgi:hypothetical protein